MTEGNIKLEIPLWHLSEAIRRWKYSCGERSTTQSIPIFIVASLLKN